MKRSLIFLTFCILSFSASAMHSAGSDSCGLGWAVTKEKTLSATSTRGTTNGFLPPTLGMTSGTIGCDKHSIAQKDLPVIRYVATHLDVLKYEMAMGSGERLMGLAQLMNQADTQCFAETLQTSYVQIVPGRDALEVFKAIQKVTTGQCPMAV